MKSSVRNSPVTLVHFICGGNSSFSAFRPTDFVTLSPWNPLATDNAGNSRAFEPFSDKKNWIMLGLEPTTVSQGETRTPGKNTLYNTYTLHHCNRSNGCILITLTHLPMADSTRITRGEIQKGSQQGISSKHMRAALRSYKLNSLQFTINTNLLAELKHQAPN